MNKSALAALLLVPGLAHAQTQVPGIQATATAAATATATAGMPTETKAGSADAGVPASMPPPVKLMAPSAPLNDKERQAVALSRRWTNRAVMPHAGEDGLVRFLYGATMPTVVCAPLQVCDLALQPGEVVNNVNLGDKVRWNVSPAISGGAGGQVTHLIIKPTDAGLMSSMTIETDRRAYAVKLVSTQAQWMPLIGFNYPDDAQEQWGRYRQAVGMARVSASIGSGVVASAGGGAANLRFLCVNRSAGRPTWTPTRAYTDGVKTYIEFPAALSATAAPALVALGSDGGWFSSPSEQVVNYRTVGDRYVVDAALDYAALISGVGGSQERVTLSRSDCR